MEKIVLLIISILAFIAALLFMIYKFMRTRVGDCKIEWADGYLKLEEPEFKDDWEVLIKFNLPVRNTGKQQCILLDMFGRLQPSGDRYNSMDNRVYVFRSDNRRNDRYFEATLIKPGDTMIVSGEVNLRSEDRLIREILREFRYLDLDLYYKYYCRSPITSERKVIRLHFSRFMETDPGESVEKYITTDDGRPVLPIRTPLLAPGDSLYGVFEKYVKKHLRENDILAVCESALAIMEGRAHYYEDIRPGFLATHLNKLFKMDSSLSSVYSLEMAIREVGAPRIIFSVIMGALGKIIGRAGDFYLFAGRAVATIDDCTGTLPPFDKYVVMGPRNPKQTAKEFHKKTGLKLAVVDVNDLGGVDVLALSEPDDHERIVNALKSNPQGNANEQTPIALIRDVQEGS